jgi:hypothetical protein
MSQAAAPAPGIVGGDMAASHRRFPHSTVTLAPPARALWLFVLVVASGVGSAQDDLYGPQAPTDVAYVRAVNVVAADGLGVRVGDGDLMALAFADATGYVAVAPGPVRLDLGGETFEVEAEVGAFLTVVAHPEGVWVIDDAPLQDASRGLLALYNLSDRAALELVVIEGIEVVAEVVTEVAPGEQAAVPVAEAEVALSVRSGDGDQVDLEPRVYERGVAHAVLVASGPDGLVVGYVASRLD